MSFLEKVEPYIVSDDKFLRYFALDAIETSHFGSEHTFFLALEALNKLPANARTNPIIPHTRNCPVTESVLIEVIKRMRKRDANLAWYGSILENCPTELLEKYKDQLEEFFNSEALHYTIRLLSLDTESLFEEAAGVMHAIDEEGFNSNVFNFGKRVFRELIKRGEYNEGSFWEIENVIRNEALNEYVSMDGIYNVFLAGEQHVTSLIPSLAGFLPRVEEDMLLDEVTAALIKIGTEDVLHEVEKYLQHEDTAIAAAEIIGAIKHPDAERILLHHFDKTTDLTTKTLIAEALCLQLSVASIPKIESLIEEGYDDTMLDLVEVLYANCMINGVDHPKLEEWKQDLLETDAYWENYKKETIKKEAKEKGIGRNDPCLCGSGKKFKKCCGE